MSEHTCPVEGCDYSAETLDSVAGHAQGKRDPGHKGISYPEIMDGKEVESEPEPDPEPDDNPLTGTGDVADESNDTKDMMDLPCGHESFEPPDPSVLPKIVTCTECGDSWRLEE